MKIETAGLGLKERCGDVLAHTGRDMHKPCMLKGWYCGWSVEPWLQDGKSCETAQSAAELKQSSSTKHAKGVQIKLQRQMKKVKCSQ